VDKDGWVFCTLTNNSNRGGDKQPGVDAANPRANNTMGHIIRWKDDGDFDGVGFEWNHFVLAGDPANPRAEARGSIKGEAFACPDGLWVDGRGVLWVETDMSTSAMGQGELARLGNNFMLAADPRTGEMRRFLTGPSAAPPARRTGARCSSTSSIPARAPASAATPISRGASPTGRTTTRMAGRGRPRW
jgi:secreted PhoX family phosphatase